MPAGFEIVSKKSIENRKIKASFNPIFTDKINSRAWKRNPAWLQLPTVTSTDDKFVGLFGVYPDSSFCALHATTLSGGNYTVDWGDGIQETVASNVVAYHVYDYANSVLAGTNVPVTFDASTDRVSLTLNNFVNGDIIMFDTVSTATGIAPLVEYYVRNVSDNTFQLSETANGSLLNIIANGSGNVLPYKQAIVTVTPSAGNTLTRIDLHRRHINENLFYVVPWLDITLSLPSATSLVLGGNTNVGLRALEQASLINMGNATTLASLFDSCTSLVSVPYFPVPAACTSLLLAFGGCRSLQTVPEINAQNVISLQQLFDGCNTLKEPISIINTSKVTNTAYMYRNCYQIKRVPWINTSAVTTMLEMFNGCYSLEEIPTINTSNVTNMASMFSNCRRIEYVPYFNTSKVTTVNSMFVSCFSLITVPLYDFSLVTDGTALFNACYSLIEVPLFNFSSLTTATSIFANCNSLESIPNYNFSNVVGNITSMFNSCRRLKTIPNLNFGVGKITNMNSMFNECDSIMTAPMMNTSNVTNMASMFSGCSSLQYIPVYDTAKVTNMTATFFACQSLREAPAWNTSELITATSMFSSCTTLEKVPEYNLTKVTNASELFFNCLTLTEIPWILNLPVCTSARSLFNGCLCLNYIPKINIPAVTDAYRMFYNTNLIEIPEINFSSVTSFLETFILTPALKNFKATGMRVSVVLSTHIFTAAMLNQIYTNLPTISGQTITVTGCSGTATDNPAIATAKGWTVTG